MLFKVDIFGTIIRARFPLFSGFVGGRRGRNRLHDRSYLITYPVFAIAFRLKDLEVKDFLAKLWSPYWQRSY